MNTLGPNATFKSSQLISDAAEWWPKFIRAEVEYEDGVLERSLSDEFHWVISEELGFDLAEATPRDVALIEKFMSDSQQIKTSPAPAPASE